MEVSGPTVKKAGKKGKKTKAQTYQVERIVDKRIFKGKVEYLVKWSGYPESDNTWEPRSNFVSMELINHFEAQRVVPACDKNQTVFNEADFESMSGSPDSSHGGDSFSGTSDSDNTLLFPKAITFVHRDPKTEKLFYTLEYNNCNQQAHLESSLAQEKYPQLVIEYLASRIKWISPPEKCVETD
ncbi:unnamed protein product [Allacma fusca]|uniref:Chromo domain-containing protein n=1 Tax=Allacma fusca TaxID=39272 RepID=A0A8J2PNF1_9HEXA|nr:unnamed protein product [Allacma fusca]